MHRLSNRLLLGLGAVASCIAATGCQITPQKWGPITSSYDGQIRVKGEGTFYNNGGQNAANEMIITDTRPGDGNNVYGRTEFLVYKYNAQDGTTRWFSIRSKSTREWNAGTHTQTVTEDFDPNGSRMRANSSVCAQMGWPVPDSCSNTIATFDY